MRFERENSLPKITISIRAQIKKNNTSVFVMKQFTPLTSPFSVDSPLTLDLKLEALRSKTSKTFFPLEKKRHQQFQFLLRVFIKKFNVGRERAQIRKNFFQYNFCLCNETTYTQTTIHITSHQTKNLRRKVWRRWRTRTSTFCVSFFFSFL